MRLVGTFRAVILAARRLHQPVSRLMMSRTEARLGGGLVTSAAFDGANSPSDRAPERVNALKRGTGTRCAPLVGE